MTGNSFGKELCLLVASNLAPGCQLTWSPQKHPADANGDRHPSSSIPGMGEAPRECLPKRREAQCTPTVHQLAPAHPTAAPHPALQPARGRGCAPGGWNFSEGHPASLLLGRTPLPAVLDSELLQPVIFSSRWRHPGLLPAERSQVIFTGSNE